MDVGRDSPALVPTGSEAADSEALREFAPAKVNLSLEIPGRRADGYHEIVSLVVFADVGDTLTFHPGDTRDVVLDTTGPFAAAIDGDNLIARAATAFLERAPQACGGRFMLDKRLPVAGGIGGGSADAAAAVRLLAAANAEAIDPAWRELLLPDLASLGADIPVCLQARSTWVRGLGERLSVLESLPELPAVLVNPGVQLPTRDVFARLGAAMVSDQDADEAALPDAFADVAGLIGYLHHHPNDLEAAARQLAPTVGDVLAALRSHRTCLLARLSGSGPTCYGLFASNDHAVEVAGDLSRRYPDWWVASTRLG